MVVLFNKYAVSGRLVLLTIMIWIVVFMMGCSTVKTAPWSEDEIERLSDVGEGKTVPVALYEF